MNQLVLQVTANNLPAGFCPTAYQDILTQFAALMSVTFPSTFSGVFVSTTPPTDQTQAWLKVDSLGRPVRIYIFAQGTWLSLHPVVPGMIQIYPFAAPDFTSFDGGDANAPGAASGPMWQLPQDAAGNPILVAQFPLAVGTLQSGAVISAGSSGGEERHSLSLNELAPHSHGLTALGTASASQQAATPIGTLVDISSGGGTPVPTATDSIGGTGTPAVVTPHNTMPPYYGVTFLQRTSRLFYTSS